MRGNASVKQQLVSLISKTVIIFFTCSIRLKLKQINKAVMVLTIYIAVEFSQVIPATICRDSATEGRCFDFSNRYLLKSLFWAGILPAPQELLEMSSRFNSDFA